MSTTRLARGGSGFLRAACILVLAACGGGGGGGGYGGGGGGGPVALNGLFIDALTTGVQYTATGAGSQTVTGTTGTNGQFSYYAGQSVAFALPTGGGTSIPLGSASPAAPAGGGNTVVFVGGMNNALQVAQVLQSLNHAASAGAIDVSGLTLGATDLANLGFFITSGGSSFGSATSYTSMMQSAQASATAATPGLVFVYPGGATSAQAAANLATAAGSLTPPTSVTPAGLYFYEFVGSTAGPSSVSVNQAGMAQFVAGSSSAYSGTDVTISNANAPQSASSAHSESWSASGNVLTVMHTKGSGVTEVNTVTFTYADPSKLLFNMSVADNGTLVGTATGSAYFLTALAPGDLAGRKLTLTNLTGLGCATGVSPQIAFSMSGGSFTAYCSNSSAVTGSGNVSAGPAGISAVQISFTPTPPDTIGNTYLLALASGSVAAGSSGTLAMLDTANEASLGVSGLFAFTAQ